MPKDLLSLLVNRMMELGVKEEDADDKIKTFLEGRRDVQKHMVRVSNSFFLACRKLAKKIH